ncbi:MAG: family 20 glycosylhydrolase, partial [Tannerella sp.]|nr:family 20 glycosylhydrolase [Tannerella sp.]
IFYGMQTFLQLLPAEIESPTTVNKIAWTAPCVIIKDEPRFGYRGMMVDACRHFMTVEDMKKHIDVLAMFKVNRLHWHLTDDQGWRIEIKQYPKLTEVGSKRIEGEGHEYGGFYTQEDVKELVRYAAERFITIIPEIELPGHGLAAIAGYPELSCRSEHVTPRNVWGVEDIVFCAGKESTFEFLENVLKEVVELFPCEYVHIGGDECPKVEWEHCPLCQQRIRDEKLFAKDGHSAEERLQSYFVQRMEKVLAKYGKKIIGWDEILEGGLSPTATVMSWRGEKGGIAAAETDHYVIMTPQNDGMYLDRYEGDYKIDPVTIGGYATLDSVYKYNPVPAVLAELGKERFVIGVQCNAWSEYMYTEAQREYREFPRAIAVAETGWTQQENKDYKDFERRIANACVRLDGHDVNYYIPQPEQPHGSCNYVAFTDRTVLEFTTSRPIKVVYTIDESEPTPSSQAYELPLEFTESSVLKIRSVLPSGKMSPVRTIHIDKQPFAPAKTVESKTSGLKMQVADGAFLESSGLAGITAWKSSVIKDIAEINSSIPFGGSLRDFKPYAAIATGFIAIPEDGVYYFSSDMEEVWIDGALLISNKGEVKRFSCNDRSIALAQGLHEVKLVFLSHIIGGWPSNWTHSRVSIRKADAARFTPVVASQLFY